MRFLIILVVSFGVSALNMAAENLVPPIDVLGLKEGINSPADYQPENTDTSTTAEFLSFDKAFVRENGFTTFVIPKSDSPLRYRYAGIGPFPVSALHRYSLSFRATKKLYEDDKFSVLFCATFLKGGVPIIFNNIFSYRDSHVGMPLTEIDFGTPPNADSMILWIGVNNSPKPLEAVPKIMFKSLQIFDRGLMNGSPESQKLGKDNLLPVSDFENLKTGPYTPGKDIFSTFKGTTAEIVEQDSGKCLHIVMPPKGYVFPYFSSRRANLDNCALLFKYRIKGKGKVHPMIWWWVKNCSWTYYGGKDIELTDQWQDVSLWRSCTLPDMEFAGCSFAIASPEADFYVDDVSLTIIDTTQ